LADLFLRRSGRRSSKWEDAMLDTPGLGTVLLFVLSMSGFCLCARAAIVLAGSGRQIVIDRKGLFSWISARDRRMIRSYSVFALSVLALMALAGAVKSYIEILGIF
jgi:hypothetical protein